VFTSRCGICRGAGPARRVHYPLGGVRLCHTQIDRTGIYNVDAAFLAGVCASATTPTATRSAAIWLRILRRAWVTGLCRRSSARYVHGQAPDRALNRSRCSGRSSTASLDEDATAIATFLKTVSGGHNPDPAEARLVAWWRPSR